MKKTPWFDGTTQPARDGVYERDHIAWGRCYSLFSNGRWYFPDSTPAEAAVQRYESRCQQEPWRGLAEDPDAR